MRKSVLTGLFVLAMTVVPAAGLAGPAAADETAPDTTAAGCDPNVQSCQDDCVDGSQTCPTPIDCSTTSHESCPGQTLALCPVGYSKEVLDRLVCQR